jgi:hypothetical protein
VADTVGADGVFATVFEAADTVINADEPDPVSPAESNTDTLNIQFDVAEPGVYVNVFVLPGSEKLGHTVAAHWYVVDPLNVSPEIDADIVSESPMFAVVDGVTLTGIV